jgi:hypothetical protein
VTVYVGGHPPPGPAGKPRPGVWWFGLGGVLVLAGAAAGVLLFVRLFDGFLDVEATIPADSRAHSVVVGTDGDRFLWVQEHGSADCTIRDDGTGGTITVDPVEGSFTRSYGADAWEAAGRFDPGSGRLTARCAAELGPAQIGPALDVRDFVVDIAVAVLVPLALGGLGLAVLIGTTILWVIRPARAD